MHSTFFAIYRSQPPATKLWSRPKAGETAQTEGPTSLPGVLRDGGRRILAHPFRTNAALSRELPRVPLSSLRHRRQPRSGAAWRREMQTQEGLKLEFLFHGDLTLDMPQDVGEGPHGNRQVIRVVSGTIDGPRIKGTTLPMSGDWLLMRYDGVMHARPEIMQAMFQGQPIKPEDLYLRMAAFFETSSPQYSWMNKLLAVGYAEVALPKFSLYLYAVD